MSSFTITVEDEQVLAALARLRKRSDNLGPVLRAIGEDLAESTKQRFATGAGPDGTQWAPNSPVTISRYLGLTTGEKRATKAAGKKPLVDGGYMRDNIDYNVRGNVLEVGSIHEYAVMQQFGGTRAKFPNLWGDIPARPFLGLSAADVAGVEATVTEYLGLA